MAINKVGSKGILDGSVAAADFGAGAITSAKLADGAVTNAKLSNSSITVSGTSVALGASGTLNNQFVDWQSVITGNTTMVAGRGYFVNTTGGAISMTLPASATIGDLVVIKDYAGTFATNKLTILRNSHNIQGVANDSLIDTNRASIVLVYVDATKGWLYTDEHNVDDLGQATFIGATGGTVTTSGNFKIHTFTGDSNFVVASVGNTATPATYRDKVDYLVVAGAGGGGDSGGGAGGFRESDGKSGGCYTASPLKAACGALTVTAQTYPITVGGGGVGSINSPYTGATKGSNSVFSTITSAGGGQSADCAPGPGVNSGGSGGGGRGGYGGTSSPNYGNAGSGNTPPVSPPQGNPGGAGSGPAVGGGPGNYMAGGGGGATSAGVAWNATNPGNGGNGAGTAINPAIGTPGPCGSLKYFAGGGGASQQSTTPATQPASTGGYGGGGNRPHSAGSGAGTANTGGGGASNRFNSGICGGAGGKGIVVIRYKYQ